MSKTNNETNKVDKVDQPNNDTKSKQGKGYNRNYNRNRNSGSRKDESIPKPTKDQLNDPNWYCVNEAIGKDAANIPFNVFPGTTESVFVEETRKGEKRNFTSRDESTKSTPGVLTLDYVITPGSSMSATSAVNVAARALYSYVRHQNSGHTNYESSDLMLYILAMDELYTSYLEAVRIYKIARTYTFTNRNIPDVLLQTLGVDADNIRANLAQFRYGLNIRAEKISSLYVPNIFNVFKRHALCASGIWTDSTSHRSQFYMYNKKGFRVFNPRDKETGGFLDYRTKTAINYNEILLELDSMLQAILPDEDINIMSGDLMKAYGKENAFVLQEVDENATADILYDENILSQIENSMTAPYFSITTQLDITQHDLEDTYDNNIYFTGPAYHGATNGWAIKCLYNTDKYFNSHKDEVDWKDALEWSRNMLCATNFQDNDDFYLAMGSELILGFKVVSIDNNDDFSRGSVYNFDTLTRFNIEDTEGWISLITKLSVLSNFDWHPFIYIVATADSDVSNAYERYFGKFGDLNKYTLISPDTIKRLHDCAVMAEYNGGLLNS